MNTAKETVSCKIEHHAMMFAFLAKRAIETCGEEGKQAILDGMTVYGKERGARMAARAIAHGRSAQHNDQPGLRRVEA